VKGHAGFGRIYEDPRATVCSTALDDVMRDLMKRNFEGLSAECDEWLDAAANARLVKNAEAYYRVMYEGAAESWNLRDTHMFETLTQLLDAKGPNSKAIVWAHNSHIGNAAFTDMGMRREELNIGQLAKEKFGRCATDRLRHAQRDGRSGRRLGRADAGEAGAPVATGKLRACVTR
jgi:erythromycin esterase-like protein